MNSVELTTVVAGHCGGCSLATVVACADGHGVAPDLGTARAARSECLFSRDRVKNAVACEQFVRPREKMQKSTNKKNTIF